MVDTAERSVRPGNHSAQSPTCQGDYDTSYHIPRQFVFLTIHGYSDILRAVGGAAAVIGRPVLLEFSATRQLHKFTKFVTPKSRGTQS
jgi:TRAP-type mannitol/chloroaromatic compound transport system permease small subunit